MRRAIIHIGMPRTGSTSLQTVLANLRPQLASEGVLYPDLAPRSFGPSCPNHQPFGETLDGRRPPREKAECLDALSGALAETAADTVILSYEDFAQQKRRFRVPETLREVVERRGFAMEVAVVVKAPSEHLTSLHAHRAQMIQERRSFRDFATGYWRSGRFDYRALVAPWLAAAQGRVTAVPLRDRRSDAPLIERIVSGLSLHDRIGGLIGPRSRALVANRSPGPVAVEVSRRLRRMRAHRQVPGHPREIGRFIDARAWGRGWDQATFRGRAPDLLGRMDAHFSAANDAFARAVWGAPWSAIAEAAPPRPANEFADRPIPPEAEAQIETLLAETVTHFGIRRRPGWLCSAANRIDEEAIRLARLARYSRWRVV